MNVTKPNRIACIAFVLAALIGIDLPAGAQAPAYYIGTITMLEAWRTGNVAFQLDVAGIPCNGQFIINKSDAGSKNFYATLLTAKATEKTVRVYFDSCGPAEGYGGNYAGVAYLYLN